MRASEALILGSTILKPMRRTFDTGDGHGCALGMMNRAVGGTALNMVYRRVFGWLHSSLQREAPCGCHYRSNVGSIVVHLFDNHEKSEWTLERIADWLDSVDPTPREVPEVKDEHAVHSVSSEVQA